MSSEIKMYMLIIRNNPIQTLSSTVDLIDQWKKALVERAKKQEWWRPIEFVDEESKVVAAYNPGDIMGIIQGVRVAPEESK